MSIQSNYNKNLYNKTHLSKDKRINNQKKVEIIIMADWCCSPNDYPFYNVVQPGICPLAMTDPTRKYFWLLFHFLWYLFRRQRVQLSSESPMQCEWVYNCLGYKWWRPIVVTLLSEITFQMSVTCVGITIIFLVVRPCQSRDSSLSSFQHNSMLCLHSARGLLSW